MQRPAPGLTAAFVPGLIAGLLGGVLIDVYLILTVVVVRHAIDLTTFFQVVASGLLGEAAFTDPASVWVGVAIHLVVSLAWGVGYAYVAAGAPQVLARPLASGIVFGLIVYVAMGALAGAAGAFRALTPLALLNAAVAHTLFFGIPIAFYVSRRLRPA
jgi:predicted lipid-binding transport protein (Tim44 family)